MGRLRRLGVGSRRWPNAAAVFGHDGPRYKVTLLGGGVPLWPAASASPSTVGRVVGKDGQALLARYDKINLFRCGNRAGRQHLPRIGNGFARPPPLPAGLSMLPALGRVGLVQSCYDVPLPGSSLPHLGFGAWSRAG